MVLLRHMYKNLALVYMYTMMCIFLGEILCGQLQQLLKCVLALK